MECATCEFHKESVATHSVLAMLHCIVHCGNLEAHVAGLLVYSTTWENALRSSSRITSAILVMENWAAAFSFECGTRHLLHSSTNRLGAFFVLRSIFICVAITRCQTIKMLWKMETSSIHRKEILDALTVLSIGDTLGAGPKSGESISEFWSSRAIFEQACFASHSHIYKGVLIQILGGSSETTFCKRIVDMFVDSELTKKTF